MGFSDLFSTCFVPFFVLNSKCFEGNFVLQMCRSNVFRGFAKGWFPKGWFWRMFPRNENRNEGTFAKTTLLETALLSPNDPFWC